MPNRQFRQEEKNQLLLSWFEDNEIFLHPDLAVIADSFGSTIKAISDIPAACLVGRIPKSVILSHKNSSFPRNEAFDSLPASVLLASCVLYEYLLAEESKWYAYINSLPESIELPFMWDESSPARLWVAGTWLDSKLRQSDWNRTKLELFYQTMLLPHLHPLNTVQAPPEPDQFLWIYSLVLSRAFRIDAYHNIGLVPLADLFDHEMENTVHFESDDFVCPICGSFLECEHDGDTGDSRKGLHGQGLFSIPMKQMAGDDCVDMKTDTIVKEGDVVYNTYGSLSNGRLVYEYGFILQGNPYDTIDFTFDQIWDMLGTRKNQSALNLWKERVNSWVPDCAFQYTSEESLVLFEEELEAQMTFDKLFIDADGRVSFGLWLALIWASMTEEDWPAMTVGDIRDLEAYHRLWWIACQNGEDVKANDEINPTLHAKLFKLHAEVIEKVCQICQCRRNEMHRPEIEVPELFKFAEAMGASSTRLALEYTACEVQLLTNALELWSLCLEAV